MSSRTARKLIAAVAAGALLTVAAISPATADDAGLQLPRDVIERAPSLDLFAMKVSQAADSTRMQAQTASKRRERGEDASKLTPSEKLWQRFERQAGFH